MLLRAAASPAATRAREQANKMSILSKLIRRLKLLEGDRSGVSTVEFALATPFLIAVLTLLVDFGMGFYEKMQVEIAAQAGTQYALVHGWDSDAIQNAVTSATTVSGLAATPAPTKSCGCPSGSAVAAADCSGVCPNGLSPGTYVTINAQALYTPLMAYPLFGSNVTLTAQSVARIQ
jgi:Flp pilus assembly protein TadG